MSNFKLDAEVEKSERLLELALQGKAVIKYLEQPDKVVVLSSREAIEKQTEACVQKLGFDVYRNETQALIDFINIHWASIEEI
jgi:spore coat polysaccharide biosynthesis protein SpsF (cytidylyltransferase family)